MIARVWHGVVALAKAEAYGRYLSESDRGIRDYHQVTGNRGATLMRRTEGDLVHFLLISLWDSPEAIARYTGGEIEKAQYFAFDRECLLDPEPNVAHYEIMATVE
jgi:heme-degrading monooxygenase HmoA